MNKLIIQHGDRVTEHEIGEHPLIIGRDPQCDLFFADKRLSCRHAQFERAGKELKLVDLDSRNGSWVNDERVETRLVTAGDSIRLGSLSVSLLAESEPEEDSTVYLPAETSSSDESRTVMLSSEALSAAALGTPSQDASEVMEDAGDATMMLPTTDTLRPPEHEEASSEPDEPDEEAPTLYRPESNTTVMFYSVTLPDEVKTGEVLFRGKVEPSLEAATRILSPEMLRESHDDTGPDGESGSVDDVSNEPSSAHKTRGPGRRAPGSLRFVALVAVISILAIAVVGLPLMRTLGSALASESSHRARALVYLLAVTNVAALSQSPPGAPSLERVIDEPGVVAAYILDRNGNVLAPEGGDVSMLPKDALEDAAGLGALSTRDLVNGDVLIMTPIASDAGPIGVAVLQFRSPTVTNWSTLILVFGALLLLIGVGAAVLLARRWTPHMKTDKQLDYPCLIVSDPRGKRKRFSIKRREATVGRDPSNDICIPDHLVSKFHAKLLVSNQSVTVIDLDSVNRTRLNGQVVTHAAVRYGDELQFARVKCQLVLTDRERRSSIIA